MSCYLIKTHSDPRTSFSIILLVITVKTYSINIADIYIFYDFTSAFEKKSNYGNVMLDGFSNIYVVCKFDKCGIHS